MELGDPDFAINSKDRICFVRTSSEGCSSRYFALATELYNESQHCTLIVQMFTALHVDTLPCTTSQHSALHKFLSITTLESEQQGALLPIVANLTPTTTTSVSVTSHNLFVDTQSILSYNFGFLSAYFLTASTSYLCCREFSTSIKCPLGQFTLDLNNMTESFLVFAKGLMLGVAFHLKRSRISKRD